MEMNEYQRFTRTTALYQDTCRIPRERLIYCLLGLSGEVGEMAEKVKKIWRTDGPSGLDALLTVNKEQHTEIVKELGDVLWYLARFADEIGMNFADVAQANMAKLQDRKNRGVLHADGDNR